MDEKEDPKGYKIVGYIIQTETSPPKYKFHIDNSSLTWPAKFGNRRPLTEPEKIREVGVISKGLAYTFSILSVILIVITIVFMLLIYMWRNKNIMKSASWRLCLLMCFGCILGYIAIILFGFDEGYVNDHSITWKFLCNFRGFLGISSLILAFGPLFAKTYRISKIFNNKVLKVQAIPDSHLFGAIFIVYGIEVILYILFVVTGGEYREYKTGEIVQTDDVLTEQFMVWGTCSFDNNSIGAPLFFAMCIIITLMFIYGLYLATTVLHVRKRKFNEALEIVVSIVISSSLMIIAVPLIIFIDVESQAGTNLRYVAQVVSILISFTVSLFSIILTRLIIICKGKEEDFEKADLKYLTDITNDLQLQLQKDLNKIQKRLLNEKIKKSGLDDITKRNSSSSLCGASRIITSTTKFMTTGQCGPTNLDDICEELELRANDSETNLSQIATSLRHHESNQSNNSNQSNEHNITVDIDNENDGFVDTGVTPYDTIDQHLKIGSYSTVSNLGNITN